MRHKKIERKESFEKEWKKIENRKTKEEVIV